MAEVDRPAAEGFFAWCRRHPRAAHALVAPPAILERLGAGLERRQAQPQGSDIRDPCGE